MKLILTNVTSANVKQVKALIVVATNLVPTAMEYTPDFFDAKHVSGYNELSTAYWETLHKDRANFVPAANPFEEGTPQFYGYREAVSDFECGKLLFKRPIKRWRLEATGNSPSDTNLLIRFAHTLGKTYQNVDVTIQD